MNFVSAGILRTIDLMFVFIPVSAMLVLLNANPAYIFVCSILSMIPISKHIGKATESIALRTTPVLGAFLNVTLGNFTELAIAIFALQAGLVGLVKASITGSILISLLIIGLSMIAGGLRYKEQKFNTDSASVSSTMLIIAITGLSIPTIYTLLAESPKTETVSLAVSVVFAAIYVLGLVFTFMTHKHLFDWGDELKKEKIMPAMTKRRAVIMLVLLAAFAFMESKFLVSAVEPASQMLGLTEIFVGVVIIGIVTNISEMINAVTFAVRNKIDLSMEIGTNSATQIALFVIPILVIASALKSSTMTLVLPLFDIAALFFTVAIINHLIADGRCNWLEGAQLATVYAILAIVFFFI